MKHLKYSKIFEGNKYGDAIKNDTLTGLNDLVYEIKDMGYEVNCKAYVSYGGDDDDITYDIIVKKERDNRDNRNITLGNIEKMDIFDKENDAVYKLKKEFGEIIKRAIDAFGLHVNYYSYKIEENSTFLFVKFQKWCDDDEIDDENDENDDFFE